MTVELLAFVKKDYINPRGARIIISWGSGDRGMSVRGDVIGITNLDPAPPVANTQESIAPMVSLNGISAHPKRTVSQNHGTDQMWPTLSPLAEHVSQVTTSRPEWRRLGLQCRSSATGLLHAGVTRSFGPTFCPPIAFRMATCQ